MEVKLRKAGGWHQYHEVYEMKLNGSRWYFINRKNMLVSGPAELARQLFNSLLVGLKATVKGSYNRETRKLSLEL